MDFCSKVAMKLLQKGVEKGGKTNMLGSPLSYNAIMNMIAAGSSGKTLKQVLRFLERKNIKEVNSEFSNFNEITSQQTSATPNLKNRLAARRGGGPIIGFANGCWVNKNYTLKDSFKDLAENLYKANIANIDCGKPEMVVQEINKWASASTRGLINEVLGRYHIRLDTTLILGNAVYFKGLWDSEFDKSRTEELDFHLLGGEKVKVPFMTDCEEYSHKSFKDLQVARIPYKVGLDVNREFAMYIFLPNENDGLQSLLRNVNSDPDFFKKYCDLPSRKLANIFWIPKFKFSYLTEESPKIMKGMGLTLPFDELNSELCEMTKEDSLYVSGIVQRAFIEVNEEGTEAAAVAIGATFGCSIAPQRTRTKFVADHPFMFIIREEKSGIMFFSGIVLNPLEA